MPFSVEHPIAYYGALAAAMGGCFYLFVATAARMETMKRRFDKRIAETEIQTSQLGAQIASVETRISEWAGRTKAVEETVASLSAVRRPQIVSTGVNATQRTQVMRLARRGDRPEQIAAALRVPRNEVDLLLKVQRAVVRAF